MDSTPSRRAVLGALAIGPLVAASPASAALHGQIYDELAASGGIASAIAAYKCAKAEEDAFDRDVYHPAWKAWEVACEALPHHVEERAESWGAVTPRMTTADEVDLRTARWEIKTTQRHVPELEGYIAACRRLVAAHEAREAEKARLMAAYRVEELTCESDKRCTAAYLALKAVEPIRPANIAEFAEKLAFLAENERFDVEDVQAAIVADAQHLARLGAH